MLLALTQNLEKSLLKKISDRYQVTYPALNFTVPPKIELGELALPIAFDLARKVRRAPIEIAKELALDAGQIPGIGKVDVAGAGYLNFHLDRGAFALELARSIAQKKFGRSSGPENTGKIIVEHTNINPNKAAHIGHLRNATLGDSFVRCLRFLGHEVEVQNYLDNTGVQVADVVVGLERMKAMTLPEVAAIEGKFDYYCWDVYSQVSDFYQKSEENKKWRSRTLQAVERPRGDAEERRGGHHHADGAPADGEYGDVCAALVGLVDDEVVAAELVRHVAGGRHRGNQRAHGAPPPHRTRFPQPPQRPTTHAPHRQRTHPLR